MKYVEDLKNYMHVRSIDWKCSKDGRWKTGLKNDKYNDKRNKSDQGKDERMLCTLSFYWGQRSGKGRIGAKSSEDGNWWGSRFELGSNAIWGGGMLMIYQMW